MENAGLYMSKLFNAFRPIVTEQHAIPSWGQCLKV